MWLMAVGHKNPCLADNGRCEHSCLVDDLGLVYCTCNDGYDLNDDKRTCRRE